jgi:hypothetical protein
MFEYSKKAHTIKRGNAMKKIALLTFLLTIMVSGCSVLGNSESYYQEHPLGPSCYDSSSLPGCPGYV